MRFRLMAAAMMAAALTGNVAAEEFAKKEVIGNWYVSSSTDRFDDNTSTQIALTMSGSYALGVKCQDKKLTLSWASRREPITGKLFLVKLRVDKNPIVDTVGQSLGPFVQIETTPDFLKSMRAGKETAVRIAGEDGVYTTEVFQMTGAPKAFAGIAKECGLDEKVTH